MPNSERRGDKDKLEGRWRWREFGRRDRHGGWSEREEETVRNGNEKRNEIEKGRKRERERGRMRAREREREEERG